MTIQDLPGIYSLSLYTLGKAVARSYLVNEKPDVILNIIDGTNSAEKDKTFCRSDSAAEGRF